MSRWVYALHTALVSVLTSGCFALPQSISMIGGGGQPKPSPNSQVTAEFHPLFAFPPLFILV